jgi:SAM-dependent methyltransferase
VANFPPFKAYILAALDELIDRHGLRGPFLDLGCGRGDVSAHLARRGWTGTAFDTSPAARALARARLAPHPSVALTGEPPANGRFETIVALDVVEHVDDDRGLLAAAAARQPPGGALVLTVPTNPEREWRWDDDFYGHLRRYRPAGLAVLLADVGYRVVEMWDVSFPVFWLLRRGFTALKRAPALHGTAAERTAESVTVDAWALGPLSDLLARPLLWRPAFALQRRFRHHLERGHEMIALARRAG